MSDFLIRFDPDSKPPKPGWRRNLYEVVFETDSPAGQRFDMLVLVMVLVNLICVSLETVSAVYEVYGPWLEGLEWVFTILFTIEYFARLICCQKPLRYVFSVLGLVDLIAAVPTYISPFFGTSATPLKVIRGLRLLRVFRVLHMGAFVREGETLFRAVQASTRKIVVFTVVVLLIALFQGSLIYFVEGGLPDTQFTSIPRSVYWAIVTITTVGYGDISPQSGLGQALAATLMVAGYGILAVPTGIVTAEMVRDQKPPQEPASECSRCGFLESPSSKYCRRCGLELLPQEPSEAEGSAAKDMLDQ